MPELASVLERVVDLSLERFSVRLSPAGGISEPAELRRPDGSSVYTVADSAIYTSQQILDAETRLLAFAGRRDGMVVGERSIGLALLEAAANGVELNTGQVNLVRSMASSGDRLQLALAPAGTGKTTAMSVLTAAWREAGGEVIGMAPSAAAAAALGEQLGGHADTLHILTHGLSTGRLPAWARQIGPRSLVVIDEAGMADTLTLESAVSFVVGRGGSVRLVGDDHQLAAVEAGGVLKDLAAEYGAVRLTEVVRFADAAEAAASLALREGRPDALGFYLDQGRVHIGGRGVDAGPGVHRVGGRPGVRLGQPDAGTHSRTRLRAEPPGARPSARRYDTGRRGLLVRRQPGVRGRHGGDPAQRATPSVLAHRLGAQRRSVDGDRRRPRPQPDLGE